MARAKLEILVEFDEIPGDSELEEYIIRLRDYGTIKTAELRVEKPYVRDLLKEF